jgi:hypothetical protein
MPLWHETFAPVALGVIAVVIIRPVLTLQPPKFGQVGAPRRVRCFGCVNLIARHSFKLSQGGGSRGHLLVGVRGAELEAEREEEQAADRTAPPSVLN